MPDTAIGRVTVTVVHDSGDTNRLPGARILEVDHVPSIEPADVIDRSRAPDARARVVLNEAAPPSTPWVFSAGDPDAPAPRRVLLVREAPEVMDVLVSWARANPLHEPYGQQHYDGFFNNPNLMTLDRDLPVPPPAKFRQRS